MSKMSQLHAELSEQASELGYESLGEAEQAGCEVDWENVKLIPPEEAAHRALLHERNRIIVGLSAVKAFGKLSDTNAEEIDRAIEFIIKEVK